MQLPARIINAHRKTYVTRRLPAPGEVLVQRGQQVAPLQAVARCLLPQQYHIVNVAQQLGASNVEVERVMLKQVGDMVDAGEPLAEKPGRFPFLRRAVRAPMAGRLAAMGNGWILLETQQRMVELQALVHGVVTRILPNAGVIIETRGAVITAVCGFGGEAFGPLKRLATNPFDEPQPDDFDERFTHTIVLAGRSIDEAALRAAEAAQVRGIIVGSFDASLMSLKPRVNIPVVAAEGFGNISISSYTFGVLGAMVGKEISIRGVTPAPFAALKGITAAELPLIVMSSYWDSDKDGTTADAPATVEVGSQVRICRGEFQGAVGTIDSIPPEPQVARAGIMAAGAMVKFDNELQFVPWTNLELVL